MDSKEAEVYLATADDQLKSAERAFREGSYSLCAFLSASCAENATSALLITLGARPSRKHRNSLVVYKLAQGANRGMRRTLMELVEHMKTLEPHVTKARYPILKGENLLPPSKFYTCQIAEDLLTRARKALEKVKLVLNVKGLQQ